jgi:hypothetical protein
MQALEHIDLTEKEKYIALANNLSLKIEALLNYLKPKK